MSINFENFIAIKPRIEFGFALQTISLVGRSPKDRLGIICGFLGPLGLISGGLFHVYFTFDGHFTTNIMTSVLMIAGALQINLKNLAGFCLRDGLLEDLLKWIQSFYEEKVNDKEFQDIIDRNLLRINETWKLVYKLACVGIFIGYSGFVFTCMAKGKDGVVITFPFIIAQDHPFHTELMNFFIMIFVFFALFNLGHCALSLVYIGLVILGALNIVRDFTAAHTKDIKNHAEILKIIARRHLEILQNLNLFNEVFFVISFFHFLFSTIIFVLIFFFIRTDTTNPMSYMVLNVIAIELFGLCLFGEIIKIKTEQLAETFYLISWYELNVEDQKKFLIILGMMKRSYGLRSAGMFDINIYAFIKITKMAMSYCAILLTLDN